VIAKQANNFSGDPGNDLTFDPANSALTTSLTGTCHLGFDFVAQPASAQVGAAITSVTYDPAAPPVAVQVLDGSGTLISSSTAPVTLTILNNPGGGFLSGTTTVDAVGGVATFPGIHRLSGLSYTPPPTGRRHRLGSPALTRRRGDARRTMRPNGDEEPRAASWRARPRIAGLRPWSVDCANYTDVRGCSMSWLRTKSVIITTGASGLKPLVVRSLRPDGVRIAWARR
jgi:hypothetical protein